MDTSASVELCWLKKPQVMTDKVTKRHIILKYVLLEEVLGASTFLQILFLNVLLDQPSFILIKYFENGLVIKIV